MPRAGDAAFGVCYRQPPCSDGARDGEVPPRTARRSVPDEADDTAKQEADDKQDGAPHAHNLLAVPWMLGSKTLVAMFVVPSKTCHQLLRISACRVWRLGQEVLGIAASKRDGHPPAMEDLHVPVLAPSTCETEVDGPILRDSVHTPGERSRREHAREVRPTQRSFVRANRLALATALRCTGATPLLTTPTTAR